MSFAEGGTPPEAVEVSACDDAGRVLRTARSDLRSGWTYRLAPLEEGAYKVSFSPVGGGWLPAWYDQASDAPAADPVAVTSGQVTPGVDARLEAAGATAGPIFADDFSDGNRVGDPSWIEAGGEWSALPDASGGGRLFSSSLGRNVAVVRELDPVTKPFTAGELEVAMRLTGSHRDAQVPNAALVFGYLDPGRYRYVRVTPGRIQIGQRGERGSDAAGIRATVPCRALRVGRWLRLRVVAHPDGGVTVRLGDAEVASARFDAAAPGGVGLAATRAVSHFAGFAVRPSPAPPGGPSPRR